ncbi:hypothetical protein D3C85_1164200 [compost metagenome]
MPGVDGFFQLHVGRRQHPHIDGDALARAQAHHFALLQHAQQLDLDRHRQVADLVEEQGAAVGFFEPAGLGAEGAGECAFFVTEQLGLDQRFGKRPAVDRHERLVAPAAQVVDVAGHQLFAGAGFADDQYAGFTRRNPLQVRQQGPRLGVFKHLRSGADRGGQGRGGR